MNFGEKIKKRRIALGISAEELAEKVNVSPATIYRYESGEIKAPRQNIISNIAKILNAPSILTYDWDDMIGNEYIPALDDVENEFIEKMRALDDYGVRVVTAVLDIEYERCIQTSMEDFQPLD